MTQFLEGLFHRPRILVHPKVPLKSVNLVFNFLLSHPLIFRCADVFTQGGRQLRYAAAPVLHVFTVRLRAAMTMEDGQHV